MNSPRISINPLPWILDETFHLDEPSLRAGFTEVSRIGFTAVQSDVPEGMSVESYKSLLGQYDLKPAPGYFAASFELEDQADVIAGAKVAAKIQADLGAEMIFIAGNFVGPRFEKPSVGFGFDAEVLERATANLSTVSGIFVEHGIIPALHPHVGTVFEIEDEIEYVLENIPASILAFGPDIGHLCWAGMNPKSVMSRHLSRIKGVHLKDVDSQAVAASRKSGANFMDAAVNYHVWTEPGRGDAQLAESLELLSTSSDIQWYTIEVDVPNIGTATESSQYSFDWLTSSRLAAFV